MTILGFQIGRPSAAPAVPAPLRDTATEGEMIAVANAILAHANAKTKDPTGAPSGRATRLTAGLTPAQLASYLDEFYAGNFRNIAMLWDAMEEGDTVCAPVREKRLGKITAELRDYTVEPLDDTPAAATQAEFIKGLLESRLRAEHGRRKAEHGGLRKGIEFMCDAIGKKYSFLAKVWEGEGDNLSLTLRYCPLWHFREELDGSFRYSPNPNSMLSAAPVGEDQWVIAVRRRAIMQAASIAICLRRLPVQQVARVLEKFGVPNVFGTTTAPKDSPGWQSLYNAIVSYMSDMPVLMSEGSNLNLLESKFNAAPLHKLHLEWCTTEVVINWLGGELGTISKSGSGTLAGNAQADDLDDLIRDDCDWLTEIVNEQIVSQAIALRYGADADVLVKFVLRKPDDTDDKSDMDILERAVGLGAQVPVSHIYDRFGIPEATEGDPILTVPATPSPFGTAEDVSDGRGNASGGRGSGKRANLAPPRTPHFMRADSGEAPNSTRPGTKGSRANAASAPGRPPAAFDRRPDIDELIAASLQPVGSAYADMLQPLFDRIAGAPDFSNAGAIADSFVIAEADLQVFAERIGESLFAAAMMGFEPCRDGIPTAVVSDGRGNASGGRGSGKRANLAPPRTPHTMRPDTHEACVSRRGFIGVAPSPFPHDPFPNALPPRAAMATSAEPDRGDAASALSPSVSADLPRGVRGDTFPRPPEALSSSPLSRPHAAGSAPAYSPLPFDEARAFWSSKRLVASFADLERLDATWLQARALGFKIAGITEQSALRQIHADLERGIKGEATVSSLVQDLRAKYDLNAKHAEIVVRTNIQSAYQWGHYQQLNDPAVRQAFPLWLFDVILDDATSDICAPLAGHAYPPDDPIWSSLYPPNHYQCRTTVTPISADEATQFGVDTSGRWPRDTATGIQFMPQQGFAGNIGTVRLDDILEAASPRAPKASPPDVGEAFYGIPTKGAYRRDIIAVQTNDDGRITSRTYRWTRDGVEITDPAELERISQWKVRADWTDVHLAADADDTTRMQIACGRDQKGRIGRLYSTAHDEYQAVLKHERVARLADDIDAMRARVEADIVKDPDHGRAWCTKLEDITCIRKGNPSDVGADIKAYGITTLEGRHVTIDGTRFTLDFIGKEGIPYNRTINDPGLAQFLSRRKALAGDNGLIFHDVQGDKLNRYVKSRAGKEYLVKDFRNLHATKLARSIVQPYEGQVLDDKTRKAVIAEAAEKASALLNNQPAQALSAYIDPAVWEAIGGL